MSSRNNNFYFWVQGGLRDLPSQETGKPFNILGVETGPARDMFGLGGELLKRALLGSSLVQ